MTAGAEAPPLPVDLSNERPDAFSFQYSGRALFGRRLSQRRHLAEADAVFYRRPFNSDRELCHRSRPRHHRIVPEFRNCKCDGFVQGSRLDISRMEKTVRYQ